MRCLPLFLALSIPGTALAENLCGVSDPERLSRLAGDYTAEPRVSMESLDSSQMHDPGQVDVRIGMNGAALTYNTSFTDSLIGQPLVLTPVSPKPYDVDRVDDVLDTTEHATLADILSDTKCGPEELPQLQADLEIRDGVAVSGTVTIIAYFEDRMLQIIELALRSDAATLYLTETALLVPRTGP